MTTLATKHTQHVEIKSETRGEVKATFSRFNVVDKDGDLTLPSAFDIGAEVPISAYGHASWQGALPVGRGTIRADHETAWIDAEFFLTTTSGRETFEVIKQLGPLGEWSYGFDVLADDYEHIDGREVHILKRLHVFEVSPVLRGAGIRTTTLDAKGTPQDDVAREYARFVAAMHADTMRDELTVIRDQVDLTAIRDQLERTAS